MLAIFGSLLSTLDTTIVNVSLDTLQKDLHTDIATVQWVTTGYLLALALAMPLSGWLVEKFGAKRLYVGCLIGFTAASALCGLAPSIGLLIVFRVIQGAVGGLLAPLAQTLVTQIAGHERLGRAMGLVALPALIGPILGPTIGGLIVGYASWRWIFFVNVPIGLIGAWFAGRKLPASEPREARKLDLLGFALISPGLALAVYGMTRVGQTGQLTDPTALLTGGIGIALVATFVWYSARKGEAAVMNVLLFKKRNFSTGTTVSFLTRFANDGGLLILPLYLQQVRGVSALEAGLLLAPQGVGALAGLPLAGRLTDHRGARLVCVAGSSCGLVAAVPLVFLTAHTSYVWLCVVMLVRGFAAALTILPPVAAAYQDLEKAEMPKATTTLVVTQRLGSPIGTALLAVVLATQSTSHLGSAGAVVHAYNATFLVAVGAGVLSLLASFLLPGRRRVSIAPGPAAQPA
ncbi:MAG: Drug resistance transporter EmrB/QacA subfamily [Pseudonocardiales bacterium]|nr:Drug resistance transporter EmrB/QacA subfamily [Pseudonocardiales bacterium]